MLIDSTGIKVEGEGEWNTRKHGGPKRRLWRKIHLAIEEETLEVRAVAVTSSEVGDAPMLSELLAQIPTDQYIASITADGAYDTRKCHGSATDLNRRLGGTRSIQGSSSSGSWRKSAKSGASLNWKSSANAKGIWAGSCNCLGAQLVTAGWHCGYDDGRSGQLSLRKSTR